MKQITIVSCFVALLGFITAYSSQSLANQKPLPLEAFAKASAYEDIKLSPDGKHIAASAPNGNQTILAVINREKMAIVRTYRFAENEHIRYFHWANNERLVYGRSIKSSGREEGQHYGQIYAGNIDGTKKSTIFGYQGGKYGNTSNLRSNRDPERAYGEILSLLPDDNRNILITARSWDNAYDTPIRIIRLNIYNSRKKVIARTPHGNMRVITDGKGNIVAASGIDKKGKPRSYLYQDKDWVELTEKNGLKHHQPFYANETGDKLYMVSSSIFNRTNAVFEYDIKTGKVEQRLHHKKADIREIITDPTTGSAIGAKIMPGLMTYFYLDKNQWFSKIHRSLVATFDSSDISVTSITKDRNEMIVRVANDKTPNAYYTYNRKANSLQYLLSSKHWLDSKQMATRTPVEFKSRDKQTLHGYLTLPKDASKDNQVPLVTLVHGGPYGIQDAWMYDNDAQMLANNGYAVMQVNYRGSGGYGLIYEQIAYQRQGSLIQRDIIDGTKYALEQPEIINDKACIMGSSFGGYSAVMAPTIEQSLFKCSIAIAGPYNLVMQKEEADYTRVDSVNARSELKYGEDEEQLKAQSPINHLDKFNIPVLIIHGGKDKRVPPEQAFELKAALDKANKPYQWFYKKSEGHGFFNEKNRMELYQQSLEFLAKYLK